jgi:hypothetical protein
MSGDFETGFSLRRGARPKIAEGGSVGERLRRIGAKRSLRKK